MRLGDTHLSYCTNIHPGETWSEVLDNLATHLLQVKARFSPEDRFGIGLRLSARAATTLSAPDKLAAFREFLLEHDLYVFTLNGFPYGRFHGTSVKEAVYRPDWTHIERARYTETLVSVLAKLLPDGVDGSISTVPGGFKRDLVDPSQHRQVAQHLLEQTAQVAELARAGGRMLTLALEPEPCCLLETSDDAVSFFENHLLARASLEWLSQRLRVSPTEAEQALFTHLGICLDTCHAAVEFERPRDTVARLKSAGLRIAKLQASAGLRLPRVDADSLGVLSTYDEPVYLHQVVARQSDGQLLRFEDLPLALGSATARNASEWRVHFHVPLYRSNLGLFENMQSYLDEVLMLQRQAAYTRHVEVETYTWDVLPEDQRQVGLVASIARELDWVRERLGA